PIRRCDVDTAIGKGSDVAVAAGPARPSLPIELARPSRPRSIAEQKQPADVRVVLNVEERGETSAYGCELPASRHGLVLPELLRNQEKEVVSVRADVALPEVEQVHVVDRGLASLDFEDDAGLAHRHEVIWAERAGVLREETRGLVAEPELSRVIQEDVLD